EDDLVFVIGHPGTTNRLETLAKLEHRRDVSLPYTLARLRASEAALTQYGERGPEEARRVANDLHRVANSRKAFAGQYQGLLDPAILRMKFATEYRLLNGGLFDPNVNPHSPPSLVDVFQRVAAIQKALTSFERE